MVPRSKTAGRGVGLWSIGYKGAVIAAGATPEFLKRSNGKQTWSEVLERLQGRRPVRLHETTVGRGTGRSRIAQRLVQATQIPDPGHRPGTAWP